MLKWITGCPPKEGQPFYVKTVYGDGPFVACFDAYGDWNYADGSGCCAFSLGDSWLPVPTPAYCEKLEALREAAKDVLAEAADYLDDNMGKIPVSSYNLKDLERALAALDAKERDNA